MIPHTFPRCPAPAGSPWGPVDYSKEDAPGLWSISTPGHGGIFVSRERLGAMPRALVERTDCYPGGQYFEEDIEWARVALAFPDVYPTEQGAARGALASSHPAILARFDAGARPLSLTPEA